MCTTQPSTTGTGQVPASTVAPGRANMMLALATLGFAVNFWAWALLSPLGPRFKDSLHLSSFQQALLVAVPVVVGSVGRIPVGALTDRFGGRIMFPLGIVRDDHPGAVPWAAGPLEQIRLSSR
jgi:NNP family nitrate/nitrite transporter-like MFS transporter